MIYITHDIDWLTPWHPLALLKRITHGKRWLGWHNGWNADAFLNSTEWLLQFHADQSFYQPIWLLGASALPSWTRYGLRYQYNTPRLKETIALLQSHHSIIGLHSVYGEHITSQVQRLNTLTGANITFHRSHFLRFNPNQLYHQLEEAGITTDFSQGAARSPEITPTYIETGSTVKSVPTILFDNAFFFHPAEHVFEQFKQQLAALNGKDAAILFHPENLVVNPSLRNHLQRTIAIIREQGLNCY